MRRLALLVSLVACSGDDESTPGEAPALQVLSPQDGATVGAGDVAFSLVVDNFVLVEPVAMVPRADGPLVWAFPTAYAHGTGAEGAEGWVSVALDGGEVLQVGDTQGVVPDVAVGSHTLSFVLIHEDGDPVDPEASASISLTAQ